MFLLLERLSRIHAEHQETSSAPHAASVTCGHRGEGEADDTGEHTCGGQLVTAQMLADVTQGHAEQPEPEEGNGEGAGAPPDLRSPPCSAALGPFLGQHAASSGFEMFCFSPEETKGARESRLMRER